MADDAKAFKVEADLSSVKKELDEVQAKVEKLNQSFAKTAQRFGNSSPQATMVNNALLRASAELDKKIAAFNKLSNPPTPSGGKGSCGSNDNNPTNRDLENRYKRESLKYYKDFSTAFGRTSKLVTGGISGIAAGEGLGGFQRGLKDISSSFLARRGKQFLAAFASGAAIRAASGSAVRKGGISKAAG